jgi:hypothetical protein
MLATANETEVYTCGLHPGERVSRGYGKTSYIIQTKPMNNLSFGLLKILALKKIRIRVEVLACQKQIRSSH